MTSKQYMSRLGELLGDVEVALYKHIRARGAKGTFLAVGDSKLDVRSGNHQREVYLNGKHVLQYPVETLINVLSTIEN